LIPQKAEGSFDGFGPNACDLFHESVSDPHRIIVALMIKSGGIQKPALDHVAQYKL
jgi:hypothetical protein